MSDKQFAFVYYNGNVLPCKGLWAIIPVKLIEKHGNPAMLTDPTLIDVVPWPEDCRFYGNEPCIKGRILQTGGKSNRICCSVFSCTFNV